MLEWVPVVLVCTGAPLSGIPTNCFDMTLGLNEAQLAVEAVTGTEFTGTSLELCTAYIENLGPDYARLARLHGRYAVVSCVGVER